MITLDPLKNEPIFNALDVINRLHHQFIKRKIKFGKCTCWFNIHNTVFVMPIVTIFCVKKGSKKYRHYQMTLVITLFEHENRVYDNFFDKYVPNI